MSEAAVQGQGVVATNPQTTTVVKETAGQSTQATADWTQGLSEDMRGYISNKGFRDPAMVVEGYRNLEKLRGVPAERLLTIPERYDDAEGWKGVYNKLGRPEKPEGYKIPVPEQGGNPEFAKAASTMFHEAGLTVQQGEALVGKWNQWISETQKANEAAYNAKIEAEDVELKKQWGLAFEANVQEAKKAAMAFGLTEEHIQNMEKAIGLPATMKFFHQIGVKMGEAELITSQRAGAAKTMTPEGAKSRIADLMRDTHFFKRLTENEISAKEEWENLHKVAYPGEMQPKVRSY